MTGGCEGQTSGPTLLRYFAILQTSGGVSMSTRGFLGTWRCFVCYSRRICWTKAFHSPQGVSPSHPDFSFSEKEMNKSVVSHLRPLHDRAFRKGDLQQEKLHLTFATERTPYSVGRNDPGDIYSSERDVLHAAESHQESFSLQGMRRL